MQRKIAWSLFGVFVLTVGCARVQVEAPKDPIKMDISMRLDVYQHVAKDIDAIENLVEGEEGAPTTLSSLLIPNAYAAMDDWSPEAKEAALRRRDRRSELKAFQAQGVLGESRLAMVVTRGSADAEAQSLLQAENADRMIIYKSIAKKNGSSIEEVQKIYAEKLRKKLASGTPVENPDGTWTAIA